MKSAGAQKVAGHGQVIGVIGILLVDDIARHTLQGLLYLLTLGNSVQDPVGNMLTGNAQGCPILHQANVMDVWYLGATNPLINPAHDITQDRSEEHTSELQSRG